jgi:hypothetical protein
MKKYVANTFIFFAILFMNLNINYAQEINHGSWGISAAVNGTETDIVFPIWTDNSNYIAPAIGLTSIGSVNTDLSAAVVFHHYIEFDSHFSPFYGFRGGAIFGMPKTGTSTTDGIAGLLAGGEYFFNEHFSMGVEAQLNFTFSDKNSGRFGNPGGTNINTGTLVYASVYF